MANESRIATVARKLLLVALGVSACCSASLLKWDGLFAAEPASERLQESPLEYRRVYVPADHPDSWPRGEAKYIPLERTDFEAWMAEANRSVNELLITPIIDSAEYQAWLGEDDQLQGRGSWKISMTATTPALMPMVPLSFVMNDPRWQEDHSQLARLGHWGTSGKQAVSPGLQVPKAGVLEFEWSLYAQTTGQDPQFIWKTPPATRIRLTIDLPADKEPRIDGASVLRMETLPSRGDTEKPATRRWVLSLASAGNDVLRFARAGKDLTNGQPTSNAESLNSPAPPSIKESVKYRESVEYEFQSRGLQTRYRWRLESNEELPRELSATLVPGMQLVEVTRGGDEQSWRVVRGIAPAPDRVIISISPQRHSEGVEIELTTWQALQLDSDWKLPVLRPDHVVWSGGDFMLELPKEFELRSLVPTDCQQLGIEGPTAARPGRESLSLIEYSPSAALGVLVSRRSAQSVVQSYTTLALTESEATGKLVSKWKVSNGSQFKLCGALGPGWTLDAVETTPSNALAEWYVVRNGDRRLIEIALTEGATPERDITVTLAGRLNQLPGSELLPLNALRILEWQDARVDHHWLSLQTAEPFGAEPLGGLRQIDKRTAADADNPWDDLVEAGGPLYDLAQSPAGAAVRVATKRAQLAAEISIDCASSKNEHHCTWEIAIQPEHNAIDRFLLYSTSPLRDDVRWTERSTHAPVVAVRIDANSPLHTGLPPEGELWQLRLQQPTNQPIRVQAESLITTSESDRIPLVAVLDALRQNGRVLLRGELKTPPVIETSGLVPTPLPPDPPKRLQRASGRSSSLLPPVLASYRYDPSDCLDATRRTRLAIQSAEPLGSASVVVRHLAIESYYWPQGRSSHRMTFDLVNRGANEFQPTLPTEARVMTVYANGKVISMSQSVGASPFPPIPLPAEEKFVRAVVEFELEQSPWASAAELRAPVIAGSAPVLGGEWKAWLPDDYEARIAQPSGEHRFDWRERLFGPLARKNHQTVFRPFRSGDWAALINGLVDWNSSPLVAEPTEGIDPPMPRHDLAASTPLAPIPGVLSVNLFPLTWAATAYATQPAAPLKVLPGWHSVSQSFVGESSPLPIFASRPALIDCWTLALALGSLLLGTLFGKRYVRLIALLALIAACGAMLLSFPYAASATGTMWGLLLAAARNAFVWRRDNPTDRKTNESRERSARPAIILRSVLLTGFALVALMGNSRLLRAAETVASAAPSIEQVLIPIDAARQPVGSKLFVSEHFLRTILQSRSTAADAAPQWLLHGATYHCEMSGVQKQSGITPGNCALAFSIETLARSTRIVLPLDQSEASWQPSAMLDGVPLPIVWCKDGRSCELLVPDPGRYVLTFLCVPKVMKQEGRERLRLKVPPVMSATIEVRLPAAIKGLRIEQCKLQAGPKSVLGLVKGELVSSNVVDVNWPGHTGQSDAGNELRILEMKWLDIGSKETTLRAKYQIEGDSRNTGGLRIRYDKHWLLQQTGEFMITPDAQAADESKRWRTVTVPLSSDDGQRQEVELGWVLRDAPQAGHLHVPVIEVVSAPVTQSWLALSSSAEFDCSLATNGGTSITVPEFLSRWGTLAGRQSHNRTPPTLALASTEAGREWIATIKPKLVPGEIREAVHCAAGTTMASVAYRANVTPGSTYQFQFSVQVPTSLRIESVQVAEGDRSIPVRWARGSEDTLHVFFSRQATSKYRLAILGHMPIEMEQTVSIPRFDAVENSKAAAASLQQFYFYREDSVNVEPARFPEASVLTSDSLDPPPASWRVRPIGVYQMDAEQSRTATFRVQSMKNELRGDSVISLSREGAAWSVRYRVSLRTNLGAIDGARIHLPADCLGPYQVVGSVPLVAEVPEPKEHGVVIPVRFVNSLKTGEETTIQVKCQLATFPAILISVPHITIEGLSGGRRFVTVPTSLDGQQLTWTTASAAAAELPPSLAIPDAIQSNDAVYEYAKESFQVAIPAVRTHEPAPRIRFADVAASVGERGGQAVVSRFILSPDGIAECVLKLPADQELISVEIDGYPAIASFAGASRWRVPLRSPQLPGVLEVVSSFQSDSQSAQQAAVERPMLLSGDRPVPVELCLWTVTAPAFQQSSRVTGATAVREGEQALLRFERLISTVETYLPALSTVPAEEVANWGRPWVELLSDLQSQVQEATSKPKTVSQLAQISPSREEVELVAKRLDVWIEALKNLTATQIMPSSRIHLPWTVPAAVKSGASSTADLQLTRYYVSDGTTVRVALHRAVGAIPTHLARWLSVGALTLLFAAAIFLGRFPIVGDCLSRWPHVLGVVIGLLYWAWLWPSWLGLLIIVASLWATLRFNWPGHSLRPEASTVLRSTRTR